MEKNIKDYLHLYLPYNIKCKTPSGVGLLCTCGLGGVFGFGMNPGYKEFSTKDGIYPFLRPLSCMTVDEKERWDGIQLRDFEFLTERVSAEETIYLLKQGFDLFNLIPERLAIDKTKI